jgi:hypothetical protein
VLTAPNDEGLQDKQAVEPGGDGRYHDHAIPAAAATAIDTTTTTSNNDHEGPLHNNTRAGPIDTNTEGGCHHAYATTPRHGHNDYDKTNPAPTFTAASHCSQGGWGMLTVSPYSSLSM